MKYIIAFILGIVTCWLILSSVPESKLCTIKLNDSNHASSYLTGECAE